VSRDAYSRLRSRLHSSSAAWARFTGVMPTPKMFTLGIGFTSSRPR
jgi:hypothetical protein